MDAPSLQADRQEDARQAAPADEAPRKEALKLNLGCGPVQPPGWINVDGSYRAWLASRLWWLDRLLVRLRLIPPTEFGRHTFPFNMERCFPWAENSVDAIYIGEVLEHFTPEKGEAVVKECFRVLRPGGVLRIRVPDTPHFWEQYVEECKKVRQLPRDQWTLGHTRWIKLFFHDIYVGQRWLTHMGHYHKWMYDEVALIKLLEGAGFRQVERAEFHQSRIEDVALVELTSDLIVEAVKP